MPAGSQRWSQLPTRLASAAVLVAAVLAALWAGPPLSDLATAAVGVLALWEWQSLRPAGARAGLFTWLLAGFLLFVIAFGAYDLLIRLPQGRLAVVLALAPPLVGDSAAYFAGSAWGRHRLAPSISPRKSWEGALAGLGASVLTGLVIAALAHLGPLPGALVGLALGIVGQLSDLAESALKRRAGVKDTGRLIPGHGGLLDRIDSVVPSAVVVLAWAHVLGLLGA
jgi:phosphatidate cytidylyltransferase